MRNYIPRHAPMIRNRRRGFGMYPDETCFDAARPSWLPYWLDDFTETACKGNELLLGNPTGNTAQPGTFATSPSGTVVPLADPAAVMNAQAQCANNGGSWDPTLQACSPSLLTKFSSYMPWMIGGVLLIMLLPQLGGRR